MRGHCASCTLRQAQFATILDRAQASHSSVVAERFALVQPASRKDSFSAQRMSAPPSIVRIQHISGDQASQTSHNVHISRLELPCIYCCLVKVRFLLMTILQSRVVRLVERSNYTSPMDVTRMERQGWHLAVASPRKLPTVALPRFLLALFILN